MKILELESSLV